MQKRNPYLINKAFRSYLAASVLTVAATQVANIADASIVGNLIGPEGLAAVNLSQPLMQAFYAVSCIYISSSTMLAGMSIGQGDRAKADKYFSFSLLTSLIVGLLFVAIGLLTFNPLSQLLCNSDTLRPMTNEYMRITIFSAIPQLLMYTFNQFVTIDGSPRLITRAVIVGNIFNIAFDVIFIKYCGWGISGAAWSTFIMYVVCILMVLPHFRKAGTLRLNLSKLSTLDYSRIAGFGMPLFFSTVLLSVQFIGNNYTASHYLGDNGLIALAVGMQLLCFSMIILTGTLCTIQPVGSILKGTGDDHGMAILMQKAYTFQTVCLVVYTLAIVAFPVQIGSLLGAANEASVPVLREALPLFSLHIAMQALLYNLMPVYQFYDRKKLAFFISFAQTLLPMVGFWLLRGGWIGFFLGQLLTAIVLLAWTELIRRQSRSGSPEPSSSLIPVCLVPRSQGQQVLDFSFPYSADEMHQSFNELSEWLRRSNLSDSVIFKVRIVAEELMSNVIRHAEQKDGKAFADVRLVIKPESVTFAITDNGIPFNPIENKDKGYGLMIANGASSQISYKYQFGQNMTTAVIDIS